VEEASDLVYNLINCSKPVVSHARHAPWARDSPSRCWRLCAVACERCEDSRRAYALGVAAGDHAVIIWPLLCGLAKARYYLLTHQPLSGLEAERIGLVALAVPDAEVTPKALETARLLRGRQCNRGVLDQACAQ